jgi:hypothetical protein
MHFPYVPLFFGHFVLQSKEKLPSNFNGNVALFTGSCKRETDLPVVPGGYVFKPDRGDGVNNIIVRKDIEGYYYKAHYLMEGAIPDTAPPYNTIEFNEYRKLIYHEAYSYHFEANPSKYDDYVQTSPYYIFEKDKGVYGYLPDVVAISSTVSMTNEYNLVTDIHCGESLFDRGIYEYRVIDAPTSPFVAKYRRYRCGPLDPINGKFAGAGLLKKGKSFVSRSDMTM